MCGARVEGNLTPPRHWRKGERRLSFLRCKRQQSKLTMAMLRVGRPSCRVRMLFRRRMPDSQDPDLIFRKSTTFKFLTPNDKLAVYGIDDPLVEGIACHYTIPEKGGLSGALGLAEQTSDISLACRQYGPIKFKEKFSQGDVVFSERRSLFFKKMQIVRGCDTKRNILVYMTCPRAGAAQAVRALSETAPGLSARRSACRSRRSTFPSTRRRRCRSCTCTTPRPRAASPGSRTGSRRAAPRCRWRSRRAARR